MAEKKHHGESWGLRAFGWAEKTALMQAIKSGLGAVKAGLKAGNLEAFKSHFQEAAGNKWEWGIAAALGLVAEASSERSRKRERKDLEAVAASLMHEHKTSGELGEWALKELERRTRAVVHPANTIATT